MGDRSQDLAPGTCHAPDRCVRCRHGSRHRLADRSVVGTGVAVESEDTWRHRDTAPASSTDWRSRNQRCFSTGLGGEVREVRGFVQRHRYAWPRTSRCRTTLRLPPVSRRGGASPWTREFSTDNFQTVYTIPAFYYQQFDYQVKGDRDWFNPLDQYAWKVRFAPPREGAWRYRLKATDASGTFTTPERALLGLAVFQSRVRPGVGYATRATSSSMTARRFSVSATTEASTGSTRSSPARPRFATMGQNGVELSRIWLTQSGNLRLGLEPVVRPARRLRRLHPAHRPDAGRYSSHSEAATHLRGRRFRQQEHRLLRGLPFHWRLPVRHGRSSETRATTSRSHTPRSTSPGRAMGPFPTTASCSRCRTRPTATGTPTVTSAGSEQQHGSGDFALRGHELGRGGARRRLELGHQ